MRKAKTVFVRKAFAFVMAFVMALAMMPSMASAAQVPEGDETAQWKVIKDGETKYYQKLSDFSSRPVSGSVITLLKDNVEIPRTCFGSVLTSSIDITIDLNGKTLVSTNTSSDWSAIYFHTGVKNGNLTLKNGTLEVKNGSSCALHAKAGQTINLAEDFTIDATCDGVFVEGEGATLNTAANIVTTGTFGIVGNGTKSGTAINITGGNVKSKDVAIYHPQGGELNISAGNIEAEGNALYAKSGNINISGGNFKATANASEYQYNGNGCNPTGDAVVFDNCGYPGGPAVVEISGGNFDSLCADGIASYSANDAEPLTGFVSGGTFSGDFDPALCVEGMMPVKDPNTGLYSIAAGEIAAECDGYYYADIQSALEYAANGHVVTLYKDYEGTCRISSTLRVKKNGFKFNTPKAEGPYLVSTSTSEGITTYSLTPASWEAEDPDGTKTYSSGLQSLLSSPANGRVVRPLVDNLNIARTCVGSLFTSNVNVTLDLDGKTVNSTNTSSSYTAIYFHNGVKNGNLTIKNGTLNVPANTFGAVMVRAGQTVNLEESLTINTASDGVYIEGEGSVLNTSATINGTGTYGIVGNGTKHGTTVNVLGGKVSAGEIGIYNPQNGTLNISGGVVEAGTAAYVKSGNINVSGGTLHSSGNTADYQYNGNGCNPTGDGLVVDNAEYPGGAPVVNITGGTILSDNNKAVGNYAKTEGNELDKFITGGTFSSDVSDLCKTAYTANKDSNGRYVVEFDAEKASELFDELQRLIDEQQALIDSLDDTYATDEDVAQKIADAKEAIEEAQKAIDAAQNASIEELENAIADAIDAMNEADAAVLDAAKAYTDAAIANVQDQIDTLSETIDNLDGTYATDEDVAQKIAEAKNAIEEARNAIDDAQNAEIQSLVGTIESMNQALQNANTQTLEAAKAYTDLRADDLQRQLDNLKKEIAQNTINMVSTSISAKSASYQSIKVSWNTSKITVDGNKVDYTLYYKKAPAKKWTKLYSKTCDGKGNPMVYTAKNLKTGSKYQFYVIPSIKIDSTTFTGSKTNVASAKPTLKKVVLVSAKAGKKKITVKFKKVAGATGYVISYRAFSDVKTKTKIVKGSTSIITKTISKVKSKKHVIRVRAFRTVNGKKVYGAFSEIKRVKVR